MITYTYEPVRATATRKGACPTCGKPAVRRRTFENTINPFNKRADGEPKTYGEVFADVQAQADAWTPDAEIFEHEACRAQRLAPPVPDVVEPYRRDPQLAVQLDDERTALVTVATALGEFDLFALGVTLSHGFHSPLRGHSDPIKVDISAGRVPAEFLRWMRRLPFEAITAKFDSYDTTLRASVTYRGLRWRISGALPRPPFGDRLPGLGGDPVGDAELIRSRKRITGARLTIDQLAAVITALGLPRTVSS